MERKVSVRKLRRIDLLVMLRDQEQEIAALKAENASLRRQLEERTIKLEESGSIAEAALQLTQVFEEAQKAANMYLESVIAKHAGEEKKDS